MNEKEDFSKNERIAKVCGHREEGHQQLSPPCELDYMCPLCGGDTEKLCWSEYKYFLWCPVCNLNIPYALCDTYHRHLLDNDPLERRAMIERATEVFLDSMEIAEKMVFVDINDKNRHKDIRQRI